MRCGTNAQKECSKLSLAFGRLVWRYRRYRRNFNHGLWGVLALRVNALQRAARCRELLEYVKGKYEKQSIENQRRIEELEEICVENQRLIASEYGFGFEELHQACSSSSSARP